VPGTDSRTGDRHKRKPIAYRPPLDIRPLLDARVEQTGRGASAIITEALRAYLGLPGSSKMPAAGEAAET
jgi:hypothetical protein